MPAITTTEGNVFKGEITAVNTYPITLRNGKLIHDEWTAALFAAGYEITPTAHLQTKRNMTNVANAFKRDIEG